jgi:hypothetical protein
MDNWEEVESTIVKRVPFENLMLRDPIAYRDGATDSNSEEFTSQKHKRFSPDRDTDQ